MSDPVPTLAAEAKGAITTVMRLVNHAHREAPEAERAAASQ